MKIKISEIINWAKGAGHQFDFIGNQEDEIEGFSSLMHYKDNSITWIKKSLPADNQINRIQCVVIQKGLEGTIRNQIISAKSKELFFAILDHYFDSNTDYDPVGEGTIIGKDVSLDENVHIGCDCILKGHIHIGKGTLIEHNVTIINDVTIGEDCIIHSGTVIGKDGFGYYFDSNNTPRKVPHYGGVRIGNRVEIGCNCVIDRGTIDDTSIRDDVKIDSLVIIAHNTEIGQGTIIVGGATIGGSCVIGEKSYIAPHATIKNKTSVGSNSFIGMGVITTQNLEDNIFIGHPFDKPRKNKDYRRFL